MTDLDALEYVAPNVLSTYGMRVLIQSIWEAAQKREVEQIERNIDALISKASPGTSHGKARMCALRDLKRNMKHSG